MSKWQLQRRRKAKQKHNTIYVGHRYTQTNTACSKSSWVLFSNNFHLSTRLYDNRDDFNFIIIGFRDSDRHFLHIIPI